MDKYRQYSWSIMSLAKLTNYCHSTVDEIDCKSASHHQDLLTFI